MREQILEALKKIQAGERPIRYLGICANVYEIMCLEDSNEEAESEIYAFIEEMVTNWPNYSGDESYPVARCSGPRYPSATAGTQRMTTALCAWTCWRG